MDAGNGGGLGTGISLRFMIIVDTYFQSSIIVTFQTVFLPCHKSINLQNIFIVHISTEMFYFFGFVVLWRKVSNRPCI